MFEIPKGRNLIEYFTAKLCLLSSKVKSKAIFSSITGLWTIGIHNIEQYTNIIGIDR